MQEPKFGIRPITFDGPTAMGYYIFDSQPGATVSNAIWIVNNGKAAGVARVFVVDASTGNTSGAVYQNETDPRQDVGSWVTVETNEVTLKPGEGRTVPFTMTVPKDVRPGQHLGGVVVANKTQEDANTDAGNSVQVKFATLNIVAIQVNLPGPTVEKMTVSSVRPSGTQGDQTIVLGMRNDGTTMIKPKGRLQVTNAAGAMVQDLPLALDTFVPQTAIDYPVHVQNTALDVGDYEAKVVLTYGATEQETRYTGRFSITAPQLAQVFQPAALPPATLVPPKSVTAAQPGAGAPTTATTGASSARSWGMIGAIGGGGVIVLSLIVGAFVLGQRKRT